ncbi:hypothetical protein GUJ93_ZPchr0009g911 [Zizania palustris]|uniref:Uncharacterized protein n=1 Tax=Zizania palustris TaxID=103762 RepID=A0A8J5RBS0_ZIZPA|nr:hypothetical protein GUJ93_ZPchr0009g911 [Zizania palustris]
MLRRGWSDRPCHGAVARVLDPNGMGHGGSHRWAASGDLAIGVGRPDLATELWAEPPKWFGLCWTAGRGHGCARVWALVGCGRIITMLQKEKMLKNIRNLMNDLSCVFFSGSSPSVLERTCSFLCSSWFLLLIQ